MKFSTKDRYALLLMVELASATPGEYLPLKAVSDNQGISVKYLEQIVAPLSKAGLVESGRGSQGGYRLSRPAAQITAGDILRAVEGEIVPVPCHFRRKLPPPRPVRDPGLLGRAEPGH